MPCQLEGAIAIIRTALADRAAQLVEAVRLGGITAIEVTMSVPGALGLLADLSRRYGDQVLLGAGTVLLAYIPSEMAIAALVAQPDLGPEVARESLLGAALLLTKGEMSPEELVRRVKVPGGVTAAGLQELGERIPQLGKQSLRRPAGWTRLQLVGSWARRSRRWRMSS